MKYTEENISKLEAGQIFVFGSNESGIHGAGAARIALLFGAEYGQGFGLRGYTFALPTKDWDVQTLPLEEIKFYIDRFWYFVKKHKHYTFLITKIGCGLAGYEVKDIAPLFQDFLLLDNVSLPKEFVDEIKSIGSM